MAPFRPTNINKRAYPGNASVVGPTIEASLGISTTTCCSSTNVCDACTGPNNILGCRYTYCYCPCCNVCCSCDCTVCTQTVPGGMWKSSEQYTASVAGAWGSSSTSSSDTPVCLCCTNVGATSLSSACSDCGGFFIRCGPSTAKWFIAPSCTELCRVWTSRNDAVTCANSAVGSCGWFIHSITQWSDTLYPGGAYWDSKQSGISQWYWSNTEHNGTYASLACFFNGRPGIGVKSSACWVRATRCVPS